MEDEFLNISDIGPEENLSEIKIINLESESDYKNALIFVLKIFSIIIISSILILFSIIFIVLFNAIFIHPFMSVNDPTAHFLDAIIMSILIPLSILAGFIIPFRRKNVKS